MEEVIDIEEQKEIKKKAAEESQLNKEITVKFLLKFAVPTIFSMVIMGIFGTIDGIFAARVISVEAFGSVNIVMPFFTFTIAIAAMLSMGGCALVAKKKGAKLKLEARQNFTLITLVAFMTSAIFCTIGWFLRKQILENILGANDIVFDLALTYMEPLILMVPFMMLGIILVQFLIAEGRPMLSMLASVSGATVSTVLNIIFLVVLDMGIVGLALATGIGYGVPMVLGLLYFTFYRKGTLYFVKPTLDFRAIGKAATNGISEMVTMLAGTITFIVMNNVLIRIVGIEGVASAGILMALNGLFMTLFIGYCSGIAPLFSYNYGKERSDRTQALFKRSIVIVGILSVLAMVLVMSLASLLVRIYVPIGTDVYNMTVRGMRIASIAFLFMGYNVFATQMFTAYNDGLRSGFISFMQTFVFSLSLMILMPMAFGLTGVWVAFPLAEALTIVLSTLFIIKLGKKYKYIKSKD